MMDVSKNSAYREQQVRSSNLITFYLFALYITFGDLRLDCRPLIFQWPFFSLLKKHMSGSQDQRA